MILGCIYQEIFKACPESKPDSECKEIKDFMEECPMAQPPAYQKKPRSAKITKDNLGDAMREVIRDPKQIGQVWMKPGISCWKLPITSSLTKNQ